MSKYLSSHGYLVVSQKDRRIYEHRLVMEQLLGKPIPNGMVVHHLDHNKSNNTPENLSLMTQANHMHHHRGTFVNKTHKECSQCHQIQLRSAFTTNTNYKRSHDVDPNHSWCRTCFANIKRKRLKRQVPNTTCTHCHNSIYRYPYLVKKQTPRYCSKKCANLYVQGEASPRSKLTKAFVQIIRHVPRRRGICIELAHKFGVAVSTIHGIRSTNSRAWHHLNP